MATGQNLIVTVVDLLLSTASVDSVAILNGFSQVLQACRPMKASVRQFSRILDHPTESGQLISDYSVLLPIEIDMTVIVQAPYYRSTAQQILQLYQTKQLLTIQLKDGTYVNMVIAEMPREETPQMFDAFTMTIKFRQVSIVQSAPAFSPASPTQANTQALGQQSPYPAATVTQSDGSTSLSSVTSQNSAGTSINGQNISQASGFTQVGAQTINGNSFETYTSTASIRSVVQ
jgi:hypothetical protein